MPSISHRASLGPQAPHRAESGPAALPAGLASGLSRAIRGIAGTIFLWPIRGCLGRIDDWRALRQLRDLDDHLLRDIGLTVAEAQRLSLFRHRRDRGAQDLKGKPSWPTTS